MAIKEKIKKRIYNMNYKPFMKNMILMESNPDLEDNTGALYKEMLKRNINESIEIVWMVHSDKFSKNKIKNVKFINVNKFFGRLIWKKYSFLAKYIIDCNLCIKKKNKNQIRFFLTHGHIFKLCNGYTMSLGKMDYILQLSNAFKGTLKYYEDQNVTSVCLGFPRNDDLFRKSDEADRLIKQFKSKKIIAWLPTYRNNKSTHNSNEFNMPLIYRYAVPCIETEEQIKKLNELLKKNDITLIIKPHPAEDLSNLKKLNLSNIKLILNTDLDNNNLNIYQFLSETDAMITDYSSIYYDYLLTKKPIGLAIPDLEEFSKHMPMYWSDYKEAIAGEYIYTFDDLVKFIENVASGNDIAYEKRMEKLKLYHKYPDGNSSERVLTFFLERIGYKENEKRK